MALTGPPQFTILNPVSKLFDVVEGVTTSGGTGSAFLPVVLGANGQFDPSVIPGGTGATGATGPQGQTAKATYAITESDLVNGYAGIALTWPEPFADTDYTLSFSINDIGQNFLSLDYAVGDIHFKTTKGFIAVVTLPPSAPLIQGQEDVVASIAPATIISVTAPLQSLYQVTFYYGPSDNTGNAGETWSPTVTWEDPAGNTLTLASPYLGPATGGSVENYQSYSIPFFVKSGTPIQVSGAYAGGFASFPMNISIRIVQMPNNSVIPAVGALISIEATALHN